MLAALIGGSGVVIAFGLLLLGLKWGRGAKAGTAKIGGLTLTAISALFCTAAVVVGFYAIAHKPKAKPAKPTKSALVAPRAVAPGPWS